MTLSRIRNPIISFARSRSISSSFWTRKPQSFPKLALHEETLNITWENDHIPKSVLGKNASTFHYTWLRDNCQCPACVHPSNRQKLFSSGQVALDLKPSKVEWVDDGEKSLRVEWPEYSLDSDPQQHTTVLPVSWLLKNAYPSRGLKPASGNGYNPTLWSKIVYERNLAPVEYEEFMSDDVLDKGFKLALQQLRDYGLCFIRNVPIENERQVETLAKRFGCIRETFYGTSWDVKSVPQSKNIAYTNLYLGPHMDLMYFESPPGLQFLHGLKNSVKGGASIFIDAFKVVDILKNEDPESYTILQEAPVTFHYVNDGHHMHFQRPTIETGDLNEPLKVWYAPPFQGPLEGPGNNINLNDFYKALKKFESIIARPELVYKTLLKAGDCVIFANRRILHARDAFDPTSGHRHFRGTYVDLDDFKDKLRFHGLFYKK